RGGCGTSAHLPGVDLDPRARTQHHRAELSRPVGFRLHRRRQHHSPCPGSLRPAAGGIRRAASRVCAAARSHERGKLAWGITMLEMPPLQFAQTNGIRMGYYEAGPKTDTPPVILCHGWPEIAFSWRHQIKA